VNRILVIPDGLLENELQGSLLDRRSLFVRTATSGHEALREVAEWQPNLIILSSSLPGNIGAVEFCSTLKQDPLFQTTKLLMVTDYISECLEHLANAPADAHLVSPVSQPQLSETIAALLSIRERKSPRVPLEVLARLEGLARKSSGEKSYAVANTINVSETGLRLETKERLEIGQIGVVTLSLPGSGERLSLPCTVRIVLDEVLLHYAVEFQGLDDASRNALREYVQQQTAAAS
jgi:CheY-like chemotaxis protein